MLKIATVPGNYYKAIHKQSPDTDLHLIVGPWYHGAWGGNDGSYLGNVRFGSKMYLIIRSR